LEYVFNNHIHHTYYQKDHLAWEYPDYSLVTLCWACHEELHKNKTIPELDESGNILSNKVVCSRCYGAGWIPQYSHVECGICFNCRGERFI